MQIRVNSHDGSIPGTIDIELRPHLVLFDLTGVLQVLVKLL